MGASVLCQQPRQEGVLSPFPSRSQRFGGGWSLQTLLQRAAQVLVCIQGRTVCSTPSDMPYSGSSAQTALVG